MPAGLHSSVGTYEGTYEVHERAMPPPRRRAELVKWAARAGAGAMGLLLVISAKDAALARGGGGGAGATSQQLFADDAAQSDRIRSETIALLGGVHRRQSLLDAQGMHLKLDADMSALDKIIGKEASTRTSSLLKTSLSARIIAQASQVKKQAASLVGKSKSEQDNTDEGLGMAHTSRQAELSAAVDTSSSSLSSTSPSAAAAKAQPAPASPNLAVATVQHHPEAKAAPSTTEAHPFANDRKWSVAEEGKDMDSFFDSLNKGAAVKEAQARKEHMQHAANKVAEEERHEEEIRKAASTRSDGAKWPNVKGGDALVKEAKQPAAAPAAPKLAVDAAPKPASVKVARPSSLLSKPEEASDAHASAAPEAEADAKKERHPAHKNPHMSASALRKEESDFYSSLSTGKSLQHKDSKNVKISDSEERKSVDDFFDKEIENAKASKKAADVKGENPELTAAQADKDLKEYWEKQGEKAASDVRKVHEKVGGHTVVETAKMTSAEAEADFNKFFDAKEAKEVVAIKAHIKDSNPKMSAEAARSDFEGYFAKQQAKERLEHRAAQPVGAEKAREIEEEKKGVEHAMAEHDAMPGPAAAKDLSKYYDKLVEKAKTVQAKDDARIRARSASGK